MTNTLTTDRPAILGGAPAIDIDQEPLLRWPVITEADEAAVLRVLRSGQLSIHDEVAALESDYRDRLGVRHAIAHNNGTAALHGAMHAFGLQPGDEVIVPSATWWASVMPVVHQGGVPVFAETEPETLGLDPADVERRITPRTRAIVVVHLFGMPSRMTDLLELARKQDLLVLEDASHAHGATTPLGPVGTLGDAAVFSMQANKLVPSAEGGVLVTNRDDIAVKATRYGHYERLLPMKDSPERRFAATGFGMKFRMSPLSAALARGQLARLDEHNRVRNANCIALSRRLEALGIRTFLAPEGTQRVYFEFLVSHDPRRDGPAHGLPMNALVRALRAEGALAGAPRYPLLHQQPMFTEGTWASIARVDPSLHAYDPRDLPQTIGGNATLLKLPAFPHPADDLVEQYGRAFEKIVAHADEIPREDEQLA